MCSDAIEHLPIELHLLHRVIISDKTWILKYVPETKHQSSQWKSLTLPKPKKARQSQNLKSFDDVLWSEEHGSHQVHATGSDDQSASLQGNPVMFALLRAWKEMGVVAGQIVASSLWQCICSQHPEQLAVLGLEEHQCIRTTFLFPWSYSM